MSHAPYFTGADLIGLWHELLAMYLTDSVGNEVLRAIAQAQEEEHGGGYIAMTLTFKMATTGKWTNLTQKVANVKLKSNCPLAHCTTPGTMILVLTQSVCGV